MRSLRWIILTGVLLTAGLSAVWWLAARTPATPDSTDSPEALSLQAKLVEPVAGDDGVVEWTSRLPVVARWTLTNHGAVPIENAVLGANCQCHVLTGLPPTLASGESATVSLKIMPPQAGTAIRNVPVLVKGQKQPIAMLPLRLNVPVEAPQWLVAPSPVAIRTVAGQDHHREVVLHSIESTDTEPRLADVSIDDEEVCHAVLTPEQRPWGDDGRYVLRKYRITLTPAVKVPGTHHAELTLSWADDSRARRLPVTIEAMPSLLVKPAELSLSPNRSARLIIVPRVPDSGRITTESNSRLISLRTVEHSNGALTVEVRQLADAGDSAQAQLVVRSENSAPITVPVLLSGKTPDSLVSPIQ